MGKMYSWSKYPGDADLLAYEPGAELREIPVPILTENPGRTDEEMDMEAREQIPRVQQPFLPRRVTQEEIQSSGSQESSAANFNEETQLEVQWKNSEMSEVEPGHQRINQWEDSSGTGVETPCTGGKTAATTTNQSEPSVQNSPSAGDARREIDYF